MNSLGANMGRRHVLRLLGGSAIALAAAPLLHTKDAGAATSWCRMGPVLKIDGQVIDVWISADVAMKTSSTGPVKLKITVPSGCSSSVIATDSGFGYGYAISFVTSATLKKTATSTPIVVELYCPSSNGTLPVQLNVSPRSTGPVKGGSTSGNANAWVTVRTA